MAGVENVTLDQVEINELKEVSNSVNDTTFFKNDDKIPTILIEKENTNKTENETFTTDNKLVENSAQKSTIEINKENIKSIDEKVRLF